MNDVLPFVPLPHKWENIHGYLRRLAAANGIGQMDFFRRVAKLRAISASQDDASLQPLTEITGLTLEDFEHMRWRPVNGSGINNQHVIMLGQPVRISVLSAVRMRFCPACLAEGGDDHRRILRSLWSIFHVTACPLHQSMLVDTCDAPTCGRTFQHRSASAPWSCTCGRRMTDVVAPPADRDAIRSALALMTASGTLHGSGRVMLTRDGDLPPAFRGMSLDVLSTVFEHLSRIEAQRQAGDKPASSSKIRRLKRSAVDQAITIERRAELLGAAFRILDGWPATWHALLDEYASSSVPVGTGKSFLAQLFPTAVGRMLIDQQRDANDKPIKPFDDELNFWLRDRHGFDMAARSAAPMIARMAGSGAGSLDGTINARTTIAMLQGEPRISPTTFNAWLENGLLTPTPDTADGEHRHMRFHAADVASFLRRLAAIAPSVEEISPEFAPRSKWATMLPYRNLLENLFEGKLRAVRAPSAQGLKGLYLHRDDLLEAVQPIGKRAQTPSPSSKNERQTSEHVRDPQVALLRAVREDSHEQASKVIMRLKQIWPEQAQQLRSADLRANRSIRAVRKIRLYEGKKYAHSAYLHSVVDSLAWANATWGEHPFVAAALAEAPNQSRQGASWLDIIQVEGRRRAVVDQAGATPST
ncbi:TniQ family protein [Sphingobium abikonense]|uniref:TniQ family protein n=1 Tax=Sphingobium abikonense TaxID=86193 RepID=UPI003516B398